MSNLRRFTFTNNFQPIVESNFDITASWDMVNVYDTISFINFVQNNGLSNVIVTDFRLVLNKLTCNMTADAFAFGLISLNITIINKIGIINNLSILSLANNLIEIFNPLIALPSTLFRLDLGNNLITNFNPLIPLPENLEELSLYSNQIVYFNPSISLPNKLKYLFLDNNKIVNFDPKIKLPNELKNLSLYSNQIISFNPSFDIPYFLETLSLDNNLMTLQGYLDSETWANNSAIKVIGLAGITFSNNVDSIENTSLKTILENKNWYVGGN